jgi:hypothetical protein
VTRLYLRDENARESESRHLDSYVDCFARNAHIRSVSAGSMVYPRLES